MAIRSRARSPRRLSAVAVGPDTDKMTDRQAMATLNRLGGEIGIWAATDEDKEELGLAAPVVPEGASNGDRPIHLSHGPADQVPRRDDGSVSHYYGMDKEELEE